MESSYGFFHDVEELWIMFQGLKGKKSWKDSTTPECSGIWARYGIKLHNELVEDSDIFKEFWEMVKNEIWDTYESMKIAFVVNVEVLRQSLE